MGGTPPLERKARLHAVEHLDLALFIDAQQKHAIRQVHVEADTVVAFSSNTGSPAALKLSTRCGFKTASFQMRCTAMWLMPTALPLLQKLQRVALGDVSLALLFRTLNLIFCGSSLLPGGRVLSHRSPRTPASANRLCWRDSNGLGLPVRRVITLTLSTDGAGQNDSRSPNDIGQCISLTEQSFEKGPICNCHGDAGLHPTNLTDLPQPREFAVSDMILVCIVEAAAPRKPHVMPQPPIHRKQCTFQRQRELTNAILQPVAPVIAEQVHG